MRLILNNWLNDSARNLTKIKLTSLIFKYGSYYTFKRIAYEIDRINLNKQSSIKQIN